MGKHFILQIGKVWILMKNSERVIPKEGMHSSYGLNQRRLVRFQHFLLLKTGGYVHSHINIFYTKKTLTEILLTGIY